MAICMTHYLISVCITKAPRGLSQAWDPIRLRTVHIQRQSLPQKSHNINRLDRIRTGGKQKLREGLTVTQQSSVGNKTFILLSLFPVIYKLNHTASFCTCKKNKKPKNKKAKKKKATGIVQNCAQISKSNAPKSNALKTVSLRKTR